MTFTLKHNESTIRAMSIFALLSLLRFEVITAEDAEPVILGLGRNEADKYNVEPKGDPVSGRPSDSMRLQMNSYRWLGETAQKKGGFGGYEFKPYKRVMPLTSRR